MAGYIDVAAALDEARASIKAREGALRRVGIVRTDLRHAMEIGGVSAEQRTEITKLFPPRSRKPKSAVKN